MMQGGWLQACESPTQGFVHLVQDVSRIGQTHPHPFRRPPARRKALADGGLFLSRTCSVSRPRSKPCFVVAHECVVQVLSGGARRMSRTTKVSESSGTSNFYVRCHACTVSTVQYSAVLDMAR